LVIATDVSGQLTGPVIKGQGLHDPENGTGRQTRFPETSVTNYKSKLRNVPEERRSNLGLNGSLKTRVLTSQEFEIMCI